MAMMWCACGWALTYGLSIMAMTEQPRVFLSSLMYLPTRLLPPFSVLLVFEYAGWGRWITRRNLVLLFAIPVISIAASLTSPWHTLFRYAFSMEQVGKLMVMHYKGGPIFLVSTLYGNFLLLASIVLMLPLFREGGLHRKNTILLFIGIASPTFLNILFNLGLSPIKGYSFAPTMLVITGFCYVMALMRFRLFGVAPVARSTVMDNIADLVVVFDTSGHIVDFNAAAEPAFGLSRKRSIGERADALEPRFAAFFRQFDGKTTHSQEISLESSGAVKIYDLSVSPILDSRGRTVGRLFLLHDISDLKAAEETVKRLLSEKELLLHEVHHRIKNNMNTMASILSLQADTVADPAAKSALLDARSRMQSMMVLYTKLYISPASGELNVELYLSPLIDKIIATFQNASAVKLVKKFDEFDLDARTLFSLGLIVNELLTNAMKHAFAGKDGGVISFSAVMEDGKVRIDIADDGVGMAEGDDGKAANGFGLNLVRILMTQLGGNIAIERDGGTRFVLRFTPPACRSGK